MSSFHETAERIDVNSAVARLFVGVCCWIQDVTRKHVELRLFLRSWLGFRRSLSLGAFTAAALDDIDRGRWSRRRSHCSWRGQILRRCQAQGNLYSRGLRKARRRQVDWPGERSCFAIWRQLTGEGGSTTAANGRGASTRPRAHRCRRSTLLARQSQARHRRAFGRPRFRASLFSSVQPELGG